MSRRLSPWLLSAFCLLPAVVSVADPVTREGLIDRILAVVDEDPILASEVEQVIGLGLVKQRPEEDERQFRRRVLDRLIEQRLQFHEVDEFGFAQIPVEEIEAQVGRIRADFDSEEALEVRLAELGLDPQGLRQVLARQFMVLIYVEERLGPRIFVDLDDIRQYYEEVLLPEIATRGDQAPPLQAIREEVRALLKEQRLNEEIVNWTEELRRQADIEDYFDSSHEELPPVVAVDTADAPKR